MHNAIGQIILFRICGWPADDMACVRICPFASLVASKSELPERKTPVRPATYRNVSELDRSGRTIYRLLRGVFRVRKTVAKWFAKEAGQLILYLRMTD